jgi:hypothetical protein
MVSIVKRPIVGHYVGMDDIHKAKLLRKINDKITVIDLDDMQRTIYNCQKVSILKKKWKEINEEIIRLQRQKRIVGSKNNALVKKIEKKKKSRDGTRDEIYQIWRDDMNEMIEKSCDLAIKPILFIGFNIYPKDYRVMAVLPLIRDDRKWFFDIVPDAFASNQIKHNLQTYQERIIKGTFPIDLIRFDYLKGRYSKFTAHYIRKKYHPLSKFQSLNRIETVLAEIEQTSSLPENLYYASMITHGDTILPKKKEPIVAYVTKDEALDAIRQKVKPMSVVQLYQISSSQFQLVNGVCQSHNPVSPSSVESILITLQTTENNST